MKKTFRFIGIAAFIAVMVFAFAACPSEPSDKAQTMTFRGSDSGGDYTLVITQDAANRAFTVKANDTYKLTYAGGRTSEGKVTEVSGADTFTLKPNDESKPAITAKVSGTNTLTALTPDEGTVIVWDNGSQTTAPGAAIEPPTTQPSTPSGGAITVTNQQLYEYDWETDEFTASSKTGKAYNEYGFWDEEIGEYIIFDKIEIGTVTNGKISFKLQEAPPVSQLHDLAELWGEFGPNVTQTPNNAKAEFATLVFYDSDDNRHVFGCFSFSSSLDSHILYVDRNANITGVEIIEDEYYYEETWFNMNLKTGWNICYFIQDDDNEEIYKFTTTLPDGAGQLNWGYGVRP